jgi:Kef-type K+ transport system membrane component KefB
LRAGTLISDSALVSGAGIIATLFVVKMVTKGLGVWPTAKAFGLPKKERTYTTLLMATGLTFGSISALYGLTHHLITESQYTELVTVVILSAFVPTLIAQQFFRPGLHADNEKVEALAEEDISLRRRHTEHPDGETTTS